MKLDVFISVDSPERTQGYVHVLTIWPTREWACEPILRFRSGPAALKVKEGQYILTEKDVSDRFISAMRERDFSESLLILSVRPFGVEHDYSIKQIIEDATEEHSIAEEDVSITYVVEGMHPITLTLDEFERQRML